MAFVRKREGKRGVRWDACWDVRIAGRRKERTKTFDTQKKAKQFLTTIGVRKPSSSDPLKALTDAFLEEHENAVKAKQREKSTHEQLRQHIDLHIMSDPTFSSLRCEEIATPEVQAFLDRLYGRISPQLAAKVRTTLSHIFSFGVRRGFATFNPVRETKVLLSTRPEPGEEGEKFVLPPKGDLRHLVKSARSFDNNGRAEAVVRTLMFGGLRISELLGLPIKTLSLDAAQPKLRVHQRADRYQKIGSVKSDESRRDVVLGPETVTALKHWLKRR
jgi:integrase